MTKYLSCPWCDWTGPHERTRSHDQGDEFRCCECGRTHVRKIGSGEAYAFFPGNLYRAVVDGGPWTLGGERG